MHDKAARPMIWRVWEVEEFDQGKGFDREGSSGPALHWFQSSTT